MAGQLLQSLPAAPGLSLIIPAFNEAPGIARAVAEADEALAALGLAYEILVIDDGCGDDTAGIVAGMAAARPCVRLLRHEVNQGYGAALRTGFEAARFDRVAFTDADCQFYLADLGRLLPLLEKHDIAAGWRIDRQDPWRRRFFSWGYNILVRTLLGTGVRDCDCALKVFRKEALAQILPESRGFFVNTEMLTRARQLGLRVAEAGVRHRPRLAGASKVALADIPKTLRSLLPFWWSRVLFPAASSGGQMANPSSLFGFVLLLVMAALLFLTRLGSPLQEPDEARYAEIPRQMLHENQWLVPVLHGQPYLDKPPLLYWLVMASYRTFGVDDWAARLVPGAAGFLTVLVTYHWGRRTLGPRAGLAGAAILCLAGRFVYLGRLLTPDGLLGLWVTTALASGHLALRDGEQGRRRGWWWASALACGLGLLTKGPVALALVLPPLALLTLLDRRSAQPGWRGWGLYLAGAIGVAAPWFVTVSALEPEFVGYFFWTHNVVRFVAPFDHAKPAWFHLPLLLVGLLPWVLLLPGLVRWLLRRPGNGEAAHRPAALGWFVVAAGWGLLFFSLAGSKRAAHVLPVLPPLALALGCYLARLLSAERHQGRRVAMWQACMAATFLVLFAGVQVVLPMYANRFSLRDQVRPQAAWCADCRAPVVSYPRHWDSVSYYWQRSDVTAFTAGQTGELIAQLQARPQTVMVVKSGQPLSELLATLPPALEFVPHGRQGTVTVGLVRRRADEPLWAASD
jgi:4-amino-4-deoxy-L-arabinose transferase-like glycosyltransferase